MAHELDNLILLYADCACSPSAPSWTVMSATHAQEQTLEMYLMDADAFQACPRGLADYSHHYNAAHLISQDLGSVWWAHGASTSHPAAV